MIPRNTAFILEFDAPVRLPESPPPSFLAPLLCRGFAFRALRAPRGPLGAGFLHCACCAFWGCGVVVRGVGRNVVLRWARGGDGIVASGGRLGVLEYRGCCVRSGGGGSWGSGFPVRGAIVGSCVGGHGWLVSLRGQLMSRALCMICISEIEHVYDSGR